MKTNMVSKSVDWLSSWGLAPSLEWLYTLGSAMHQPKEDGSFRFLSLPLEIRRQIYDYLLVGGPAGPWLIYNDRYAHHILHPPSGWDSGGYDHYAQYDLDSGFIFHTEILRANKQINAEATQMLYERNGFCFDISFPVVRQDGRQYEDSLGPPEALIREDTSQGRLQGFRYPGLIYARSFQRLAHIEITTSAYAVWGRTKRGDYFSHIGKLLLQLLQILADDVDNEKMGIKKRLVLTVQKDDHELGGMALFPRKAKHQRWFKNHKDTEIGKKQMAARMDPLMEAISKKREVSIREATDTFSNIWDGVKEARNSEKAQSMLFRFRAAQAADLGILDLGRTRRPRAITTITSIPLCEKWRGQVLKEISRKVSKIQDPALSDYQIRDLNDEINKLMREKHMWEHQIRGLGGPNYMRGARVLDEDGREIPGGGKGYRYFGRARELPGVKELFEVKRPREEKGLETRADLRMKVDAAYFGYNLDEEDGSLVAYERGKEEEARRA
ncbi:MAG: hypothetical protein Q9181_008079, partial [Wetmoreana brouardii]